ncbi:Down syndrome cell adhesion molecule-like protein Dscam2 [Chrysoperla carnea]|uniref:Down syndrome cell adhesion molecule-like protein Dscam2 n=1 Tax=Chrysoperla carnea TaxID=189513 RepID=UPI001D067548|nr:Down syndrome cell adhesion molecule-like protein Dscam2 [Chrysoperla carnea]
MSAQGPVFVMEPPANLVFSNTTGSQVSCSAHGTPPPQVDWLLEDGADVTAVPGLRQTLGNGTLYFPPFRAQDYRKDIHHTVYRCRATNQIGVILSRDVAVQAILKQHYDVQVFRTHVVLGNTAVLACHIPEFVRNYVSVSSWFKDDNMLLAGRSDAGGRFLVTSGTGNLHIRSVREDDAQSLYSCLTIHSLTHERKRSPSIQLTISAATGSMPPRLTARTQNKISMEEGTDVHLSCAAQGYPLPTFTWYRDNGNNELEPILSTIRINPSNDVLYIRRVQFDDAGTYVCHVTNQFGEQRIQMHLTVTAHLKVIVLPTLQIVNSGESALFNCTVLGSPVDSVKWLHNGQFINKSTFLNNKIKLITPYILQVNDVTRLNRGMYQCIVRNHLETAQASAELRLGDTVPELQNTFIEQSLHSGPPISLRCSATGSPPPLFIWLLDGEPIIKTSTNSRYIIGQFVDETGDVISYLNITSVRTQDGGLYACQATNSLGTVSHEARLNIYGPPSIRKIGPIKVVAHKDVVIQCPFSGYPINVVKWERHGQQLPIDIRQKINENSIIGSLTIKNIDPNIDGGIYKCIVINHNGEYVERDIELIIHSPPVLEPFTFPINLQEGGRAQISCSVTSGDMPIQFYWLKDLQPLSLVQSQLHLNIEERTEEFFSILIFKTVNAKHSGDYTCIARNNAAKVNYTATLMVKVPPTWTVEPHDQTTLLGHSIIIHCNASGYPVPNITWLRSTTTTSPSSNSSKLPSDFHIGIEETDRVQIFGNGSLYINHVITEDQGYYLCRASNDIGSGLSKIIYLDINEPAHFEKTTHNISIKRGEQAHLVCEVLGDLPIQIQWFHNNKRIINNNNLNNRNRIYHINEYNNKNGLKSIIQLDNSERDDSGTYKCVASNIYGRNDMFIYLIVQEPPDPPLNLHVIEIGSRFIRLQWLRGYDGNTPLTHYLLQYQVVPNNYIGVDYINIWNQFNNNNLNNVIYNVTLSVTLTSKVATTTMQSTITTNNVIDENIIETALINNLQAATTYSLRMLAINTIDTSTYTEPIVVKTQEEAPVEAPQNVQVEAGGLGELLLTWQIPSKQSWNGDLIGYIIIWNEYNNNITNYNKTNTLTIHGWSTTKAHITGLRKYNRYKIVIKAFNSVGSGPPSVPVIGTTSEGVPEASPLNIQCSQISSQSMKISWIPPLHKYHGGFIKGYKVYYRPIPILFNIDISTTGEVKRTTSTETYLHTLYKYTNYTIRVLAYTNAGDGPLSVPIFCTTDEDLPDAPADIKVAVLSSDSMIVSWLPPNQPNGHILYYTLFKKDVNNNTTIQNFKIDTHINKSNDIFIYKVHNLIVNQLYEYWTTATTRIGEGSPSKSLQHSIQPSHVHSIPTRILSYSQQLYYSINNNHNIVLKCITVGTPQSYVKWLLNDTPIVIHNHHHSYKITNDGHLHIFKLNEQLIGNYTCTANNMYGTDHITYQISILFEPNAPVIELNYVTSSSINVKWKVLFDGGIHIEGYILNYKYSNVTSINVDLSSDIHAYTLNSLKCGTVYHIYLIAYNRIGQSSPSNVLSIKTKGTIPALPNISYTEQFNYFIQTNSTSATINLYMWPNNIECPIQYFILEYRLLNTQAWILLSNSVNINEMYSFNNLSPATRYQLQISAYNDAGFTRHVYNFATTTWNGQHIPSILLSDNDVNSDDGSFIFTSSSSSVKDSSNDNKILFIEDDNTLFNAEHTYLLNIYIFITIFIIITFGVIILVWKYIIIKSYCLSHLIRHGGDTGQQNNNNDNCDNDIELNEHLHQQHHRHHHQQQQQHFYYQQQQQQNQINDKLVEHRTKNYQQIYLSTPTGKHCDNDAVPDKNKYKNKLNESGNNRICGRHHHHERDHLGGHEHDDTDTDDTRSDSPCNYCIISSASTYRMSTIKTRTGSIVSAHDNYHSDNSGSGGGGGGGHHLVVDDLLNKISSTESSNDLVTSTNSHPSMDRCKQKAKHHYHHLSLISTPTPIMNKQQQQQYINNTNTLKKSRMQLSNTNR